MDVEASVILIPLLPFIGFLVNGLAGKRLGKSMTALIACAGPVGAFIVAVAAFSHVRHHGSIEVNAYSWITTSDLRIPFGFTVDRLSAVLCLVITGVGSLIHVYSTEYMEHESRGGYARYFAYLNLFTAMMLILVLGSSLPLLFVGWEGVGLCSFLLIGFWYQDPKNADAGKKAFIVNRVGDFGFLLGIFLLFASVRTVDMTELNGLAATGAIPKATLAAAAILLFVGACGKSAQIPLYVWLPDAMAGPTPVSALIHAATMVTAGVYMVARMHPIFLGGGTMPLEVVAGVGIATAFFTSTMGLAEFDLKKVLAYSTISQLGYMFVGVGAGAFDAGIFHLVTHAFFKALLFLGAGVVMHALDGITDMRQMGGLFRKLPITGTFFLIGSLALAGVPPFAGFFSKDEILGAVFAKFYGGHGGGWLLVWILGVLTATITAFYTFRAVSLTFFGEPRGPADVHMHAHEPGLPMLVPLALLALGSIAGGFLNVPEFMVHGWDRLSHWLAPVFEVAESGHGEHMSVGVEWIAAAIPTGLGLISAYAAYTIYSRKPGVVRDFVSRPLVQPFYRAVAAKYWVDELYERAFVEPLKAGAAALWEWVDVAVIDNAVNGVARVAVGLSESVRRLQAGVVNQYAFYVAGGAVAVLLLVLGYVRVW